ncbi:MAG: hypothetical protein ACK5P5_04195 [Pseudobdellovibrionaceae bacterium]
MKTLFFTIFILLFSFGCASRSSMQVTPQAQQTHDQEDKKRVPGSEQGHGPGYEFSHLQRENWERDLIQGLRTKYKVVGEPRKAYSNNQIFYRFNNAICRVQEAEDITYVIRSSLCYQLLREGTNLFETYQRSQDQQVNQTLITVFRQGGARGNPTIRFDQNYRDMYFEFSNMLCRVSLGGTGRPIDLVDVDANLLNKIAKEEYDAQRNCKTKQ